MSLCMGTATEMGDPPAPQKRNLREMNLWSLERGPGVHADPKK